MLRYIKNNICNNNNMKNKNIVKISLFWKGITYNLT